MLMTCFRNDLGGHVVLSANLVDQPAEMKKDSEASDDVSGNLSQMCKFLVSALFKKKVFASFCEILRVFCTYFVF